jgi:hypothetical protein
MRAAWLTPPGESAIAMLCLQGEAWQLAEALQVPLPQVGSMALRSLPGDDQGVIMRATTDTLLITPHGGPRIRQRITERLLERGATFDTPTPNPWCLATNDPVARRVLAALPHAASDEAIALLLAQPERWHRHGAPTSADAERSLRLRRLLHAPVIALVGPPNAGKSSLLNALAGHEAAAASPEPGTTRDFVTVPATLAGLACTLLDAPGLREAGDPIERQAIAVAHHAVTRADLRVSLADPSQRFLDAWPDALRVRTKLDERRCSDAPQVSARTGEGLAQLATMLRERLVPADDLASDRPFHFDGDGPF